VSSEKEDRDLLFETVMAADGSVRFPPEISRGFRAGERIVIRVQSAPLARELAARGISDEEVQKIASRQLESRERVLRFLLSEGALARPRRRLRRSRRAAQP